MTEQGNRSFGCKTVMVQADLAGCYYCINTYSPVEIEEYVSDRTGGTPVCPKCGIDSVIPYDPEQDGTVENFKMKLNKWNKESF